MTDLSSPLSASATAIHHPQTPTLQEPGAFGFPAPQARFTRALQAEFCDHLAVHGNVRLAARAVGVHHANAYRMRRRCPLFGRLWSAALLLARSHAEEVLADRALHGVEETVFYHGEEVATRRRFDTRLLLAHLARLDRLSCNRQVDEAATLFDILIDELLDEDEFDD